MKLTNFLEISALVKTTTNRFIESSHQQNAENLSMEEEEEALNSKTLPFSSFFDEMANLADLADLASLAASRKLASSSTFCPALPCSNQLYGW